MGKNKLVSPFVKWVGGKRQLIPEIKALLPEKFSSYTYMEPFVGGGAVLFEFQPAKAIINDYNTELINCYEVIRDNVGELVADLKKHKNEEKYFYELRALDRDNKITDLSKIKRASRIIYLNKTCFNGLYRVNSAGEFNSPFGRYKNPNIVNEPVLKAVSNYFKTNDITIVNDDYESVIKKAGKKTFIYFDPPYHPLSQSSNFTGYIQGGWNEEDQERLKQACDMLTEKGVKFLLSNSAAPFIKELYKNYQVHIVKATRAINSDGAKRGEIDEVLIRNYE
jgi:DNA adenine methylase